ncbi:flagellar export chaperone FliS [soil metagenome]
MFASTPAYRQYAKVGVESKVLGAGDHRLISLLFDGAIEAIERARSLRQVGSIADSAVMLGRARNIVVEGLRACLNREQGGDIARQLDSLYDFIVRRLVAAGSGDPRAFDDSQNLLQELRNTWAEIDPERRRQTGTAPGAAHVYAMS